MKKIFFGFVLTLLMGAAIAMTEDELTAAAVASLALVKEGKQTELDHNKHIYKLVSEMPASYKFKAENLRIFGARIDTLEAVEAGKISKDKGQRDLAQQEADYESLTRNRDAEAQRQNNQAREQENARRNAQAAQEDSERRAIGLQMLQNRSPAPQIAPYQMPIPQRCRTAPTYGGGYETVCN